MPCLLVIRAAGAGSTVAFGQTFDRVLTVDDLASLRSVDDVQLSLDGKQIAYVSSDTIWVIDVAARRPTPKAVHPGRNPRWSPDGTRLAFFAPASDSPGHVPTINGFGQLWIADLKRASIRQLTRIEGGIVATLAALQNACNHCSSRRLFSWSPDGSKIAVVAHRPASTPSSAHPDGRVVFDSNGVLELTTASPPALVTLGVFRGGEGAWPYVVESGTNQLLVIDVETGAVIDITNDSMEHFAPTWTPDGRRLVVSAGRGPPFTFYQTPMPSLTDIYAIDLVTKRRTLLTSGPELKSGPLVSPDGRWVAYVTTDGYDGFPRISLVPIQGGVPRQVTKQSDRPVQVFAWREDSKSLLVEVREGTRDRLLQVDLTGARFKGVPGTSEYPKIVTAAANGTIAWVESNPTQEGLLRVLSPGDTTARNLLNLNPQTAAWPLGAQEIVRWRTSRGDSAEGVLLKPIGYVPGRSYPMIVDAYPIQWDGFQGRLYAMNQTAAGRGYLVFFAAHRATHTAELYVKNAPYNDIARGAAGGDIAVDDVNSGIDFLVAKGIADSSRIGLFGHSNGGGSAAYLLTRMTRFKVAFISAPVSANWQLLMGLLGTLDYPTSLFGGQPWDVPATYVNASAVFRLDRITTPLVLAVGDHDTPSLLDAIQLYNGLRRLDRSVTLVRYPQAGHVIAHASATYRRDYWSRVYAGFDTYLQGSPRNSLGSRRCRPRDLRRVRR